MLAKMAYKTSASALVKGAQLNFGASSNELLAIEAFFEMEETFPRVNEIRKAQREAGNRNMFHAIAEFVAQVAEHIEPTLKNQRLFTMLLCLSAFEAGLMDDDLQRNARAVHASLFPDNAEEFVAAFPYRD